MSTGQSWVDLTRQHLTMGRQEERNTLAAPYTPGLGALVFTYDLGGIVPGTRLSIGPNTFYVMDVSTVAKTASVVGGQEGSVDEAAATGTVARVAPRFTDAEILRALAAELADLSAPDNGLFQMKSATVTFDQGLVGYDLSGVADDLLDVYEVRAKQPGGTGGWTVVEKFYWRLDRAAPLSEFPSGLSLQMLHAGYNGLDVRVIYRAGFDYPASLASSLSVTGLPATAYDIPPAGAAMRLVMPMEVKRAALESQGDTRRAAEVQPGASLSAARALAAWRAQRIQAESARLVAQWPDRVW